VEILYPAAASALSLALLESGDLEAAERAIEMDDARWQHALDYQILVPGVRGRIHELRGELTLAIAAFRSVHEVATAVGMRNSGVIRSRAARHPAGRGPAIVLPVRNWLART
jgi:hypothetical protein